MNYARMARESCKSTVSVLTECIHAPDAFLSLRHWIQYATTALQHTPFPFVGSSISRTMAKENRLRNGPRTLDRGWTHGSVSARRSEADPPARSRCRRRSRSRRRRRAQISGDATASSGSSRHDLGQRRWFQWQHVQPGIPPDVPADSSSRGWGDKRGDGCRFWGEEVDHQACPKEHRRESFIRWSRDHGC